MTEAEETEPLPERVRLRVLTMASDALSRLEPDDLPASLVRVASFTPARRAKLAGIPIATALSADGSFRERVAADVRTRHPDLVEALEAGSPPALADPVEVAAVAYLTRPPGWTSLVAAAAEAAAAEDSGSASRQASRHLEQLRHQVESLGDALKQTRRRHREQLAELKAENVEVRHKLGEARARARLAEATAAESASAAEEVRSQAAAEAIRHEGELRRLRARIEELERDLAAGRRSERLERGAEALRARLLLDTLVDTAQGLRRELALPAVAGSPADAVEAHIAEEGNRPLSGHGSLTVDDPALLDQLLSLPRVHLIVDGYNVTKTAWPELSLERQRDRLLGGLAPLVARSGAEVTVVFDAAETTDRPLVNRPRGVRVLYSHPGVIADDVIRDLVAVEPKGRPVVVVSSDNAVVRDVLRAGARVSAALALARLLGRV